MKFTAVAPSNIAFIKYWGKKDEKLRLPENGSISMNLSNILTTTTVEFNSSLKNDEINLEEKTRVILQLDRVRELANIQDKARVFTKNNFPSSVGLSSSASGMAALTLAASTAAGLNLSQKELSILARQGSGSACRSIPDGFVEWESEYAVSLFPPEYWDIIDVVAVVSVQKKETSTTEGQKSVKSSPFYQTRLSKINEKINLTKQYLKDKNFTALGELVEAEALELHAIMLTSTPSLIYWTTGTLQIMKLVKKWRTEGLECYFTINTGQNVHILCENKNAKKVEEKLKELDFVREIIVNHPAPGAHLINEHLF